MKMLQVCIFALFAAATQAQPQPLPPEYTPEPGPHAVTVTLHDWHDAERDRAVPAKIYAPAAGAGPFPVIIVSHGLGGSRDGYEYLGRHWASHGYVSVHLQHIGSDTSVWEDSWQPVASMRKAAAEPKHAVNRFGDVKFAIDQVERMNLGDGPLAGRLDLARIGMAGHSFGAHTTLGIAGQGRIARDPRVKAAIPMSAPPNRRRNATDRVYSAVAIPCFHMTGTRDTSVINETKAIERRIPFDHIRGVDQYLLTFNGGDHMVFSGRKRMRDGGENDERFQSLIRMGSTAFWDAYLRTDPGARRWLAEGGFERAVGNAGVLEMKLED